MTRRERIILPGETAAPDDPGQVVFAVINGIGELEAPNGTQCIGLEYELADNRRFVFAVPAAHFHRAVGALLANHGLTVRRIEAPPKDPHEGNGHDG